VIVRSEVVETNFGFYSDEEKKNILSVCKVSSIVHEDINGMIIDKYDFFINNLSSHGLIL
jgi:hypothetical protein